MNWSFWPWQYFSRGARARARSKQHLQVFPRVGFNGLPRSARKREKQLTQVEQDSSEV